MLVAFSVPLRLFPLDAWSDPKPRTRRERIYWYTLMLIDGHRSVIDIARLIGCEWKDVLPVLNGLHHAGIIVDKQAFVDYHGKLWGTLPKVGTVHPILPVVPSWPKTLWNTLLYHLGVGKRRHG